eukprot:6432763-Amphidinium_carterae.1
MVRQLLFKALLLTLTSNRCAVSTQESLAKHLAVHVTALSKPDIRGAFHDCRVQCRLVVGKRTRLPRLENGAWGTVWSLFSSSALERGKLRLVLQIGVNALLLQCSMDSTSSEACPHWARIPGLKNKNGSDVDLELKAWLHGEDCLLWELRRVYDGLNLVSGSTRLLHAWLWERKKLLETEFSELGLAWAEHLITSKKAERANNKRKQTENASALHVEYTITTVGLLVFLQIMSVALRSRDQKQAAESILSSLLGRMGQNMCLPEALGTLSQQQCLACPSRLVGKVQCVHIESLQERDASGNSVHGNISHAWSNFLNVVHQCPALKCGAPHLLQILASQLIPGFVATSYTSNPLEGQRLAVQHPEVSLKCRRADEDYKATVLATTVPEGRAASARAYVRAVDGPAASIK